MKLFSILIILFFIAIIFKTVSSSSVAMADYQEKTFARLEKILDIKKEVILSHLDTEKSKVYHSKKDVILQDAFVNLLTPTIHSKSINQIRQLDSHYVTNYQEFYDILFIAEDGLIFHAIKMESDFRQNVFEGELANSMLSRALQNNPEIEFVDYDYYIPSREPAAFFVTQINDGNKNLGWIVFQFAINAINSTLSDHRELGQTGEIYLTNKEKFMITQSRLTAGNSSLQLKVDTKAQDLALKKEKGKQLLLDYRGVMVFSVFERFEFSGVVWVIFVEIDEDEVITNFYRDNKDDILLSLYTQLNAGNSYISTPDKPENNALRVDINEYARAETEQQITTYGLITCTAVIVSIPNRYTYLGHIYPLDDMYHSRWSKAFLDFGLWIKGEEQVNYQRDLLESMIMRIKKYDIYPYELNKIKVILVAVNTNGFERIVDKLLDAGFFLSQITILHDAELDSVNVLVNIPVEESVYEWNHLDNTKRWTIIGQTPDLAQQVKLLMNSNSES